LLDTIWRSLGTSCGCASILVKRNGTGKVALRNARGARGGARRRRTASCLPSMNCFPPDPLPTVPPRRGRKPRVPLAALLTGLVFHVLNATDTLAEHGALRFADALSDSACADRRGRRGRRPPPHTMARVLPGTHAFGAPCFHQNLGKKRSCAPRASR
jgi:hypothetical protein